MHVPLHLWRLLVLWLVSLLLLLAWLLLMLLLLLSLLLHLQALELLKALGALPDVEKSKASKAVRRGKGKMRNRRYTLRKGPLVVFANDAGISKAFRNLPGVDVASVDALNLLQVRRWDLTGQVVHGS